MKSNHVSNEIATFAGGCFWCMEGPFQEIKGVIQVRAGFTGGTKPYPSYEEVCSGGTGHREAVEVVFDPRIVDYDRLLDIFWRQVDPTDNGGQFADRGSHYRTAIFFHNDSQRQKAEMSKKNLEESRRFSGPIVTEILPASEFYPAEEYHQNYHRKKPLHYAAYRIGSGRQSYFEDKWADSSGLTKLTSLQYEVTHNNATEPPFNNEFWNNQREGIYVDIITGEPLFSSRDKFESGCGWPSFTRPLITDNVKEINDNSHGMIRTEVRSRSGNYHLGHVFPDGPPPTELRYCINSAALRFVPREDLEKEGYAQFSSLFE